VFFCLLSVSGLFWEWLALGVNVPRSTPLWQSFYFKNRAHLYKFNDETTFSGGHPRKMYWKKRFNSFVLSMHLVAGKCLQSDHNHDRCDALVQYKSCLSPLTPQ